MARTLTITLSDDLFQGLEAAAGSQGISEFIEKIARPHIFPASLDAAYREMAADEKRELEAIEWAEALTPDSFVENR